MPVGSDKSAIVILQSSFFSKSTKCLPIIPLPPVTNTLLFFIIIDCLTSDISQLSVYYLAQDDYRCINQSRECDLCFLNRVF